MRPRLDTVFARLPVLSRENDEIENDLRNIDGEDRTDLDETDGSRLFTEALTADLHPVLANDTSLISTHAAAVEKEEISSPIHSSPNSWMVFTIDGSPFRTFVGERTRQRRASF